MAIIDMPNVAPSKSAWNMQFASKADFNPYSQVEQVWDEPGDKWIVKLSYKNLPHAQGRELRGALMALRGQVNKLRIKDWAHSNMGSWAGTPKVRGVDQVGLILTIDGMSVNSTIGYVGDRFQLGTRVHELTQDAATNSSGIVTLKFVPEIINPPADNEPLILLEPSGLFILKDPKQIPDFSKTVRVFPLIQLDLVEALR